MPKAFFILFFIILGGLGLVCISALSDIKILFYIAVLFTTFSIIFIGIFFFLFIIKKEKETKRNLIGSYALELLDDEKKDLYAIISCGRNGKKYIFSYINEKGKKITCFEANAKVEYTNKKPYFEVYTEEYIPKAGILNFLFYSEDFEQISSISYVLYVNDDMIKILV